MTKHITEALDGAAGVAKATGPGRIRVGLITPGWGSSGYYAASVLEAAATEKVFPAGTHIYFDHPSASEHADRPERSVRDLAATLSEDARWDGEGLVAEAEVVGPYRELLTDPTFTSAVGMSIRAAAETSVGEADGRQGVIVDRITEGLSVDLVTRAGRGGRVLEVLESAGVRMAVEATTDEVRDALEKALDDADRYVADHDPDESVAYVRGYGAPTPTVHAVPYTYSGTTATLDWAAAYEVRAVTRYEPLTGAPTNTPTATVGSSPVTPAGETTTESQEDTMPQIEEGRLAQLEEAAGRADKAEATAREATARAEAAEARLQAMTRANDARALIDAVEADKGVQFTVLERRGLMADLPATDDGDLDTDTLRGSVAEAADAKASTVTESRSYGFGAEHLAESGAGDAPDIGGLFAATFNREEA